MGTEKAIRVLCARELQNSISESVHRLLADQIVALGLQEFYEVQRDYVVGKNGTIFSFHGIKNNVGKIRSFEGADICWIEEANKVSKHSWSVLTPTIRKKGSEIWLTFNPELETDYTYKEFVLDPRLVKVGENTYESPDTISVKMTYKDNPWFDSTSLRGDMEKARERDYDNYLHVWEGFTIQTLDGAIYAKELRRASEQGRIGKVPYDRTVPVDTFWDLGRRDATAIWFAQQVAMQYRVLAYYEATLLDPEVDDSSGGVNHFLRECQSRGYVFGTMYLPHDAKAKRLGTKRSIEEIVRQAGYRVQVVPKLSRADGINAARIIFPSCWFDEAECLDGLTALRHYCYEIKDGQYSNEPKHDEASHGADAFRYLAVSLKSPRTQIDVIARLKRRAVRAMEQAGGNAGQGWMR